MKKKNLFICVAICFCMLLSATFVFTACKSDCAHTYSEWEVTTSSTCTTDGAKTRTCSKCGDVESESIPASHTLTRISSTAETCDLGILAHDHCSVCNKNFIDGVEKTEEQLVTTKGHHFHSVPKVAPTCLTAGTLAHFHCENCGVNEIEDEEYTLEQLAIPVSHNLVAIDAKAKTCLEDGWVEYSCCNDCDKVFINGVEASFDDVKIPASHDFEHVALLNSTCLSTGILEHDYCEGCGVYCIDNVEKNYFELIIPQSEHNYGTLIPASATERAHYTCPTCNKNFNEGKEEVSSLNLLDGHNLTWHDKEASCDDWGDKGHYTCSDCDKTFDANYNELDINTIRNGNHPADGYAYNENYHWTTWSSCSHTGTQERHTNEVKHVCRDDVWYKYTKCSVCGYETDETTYNVPYKIETFCSYIVGVHTLDTDYKKNYELKVYGLDRTFEECLYKMLPANSNFKTKLAELEAKVESGDTSSFPITESFLVKCEQFEQEVEITFDIERKGVKFRYPVYPKSIGKYWGNDTLGDFGVMFYSNVYDFWDNRMTEEYVSLRDTTIIDDGGFDINTTSDEPITIQFSYNEQTYSASFYYVDDERVIQEIVRFEETEFCRGKNPKVFLKYRNGSNGSSDFNELKLISGTFDKYTPGVYENLTFTTLTGYAEPITVTLVVRDYKDVAEIYDDIEYYIEKGSNGFNVEVEYFDETSGVERISINSIVEYKGEKFNPNKVGQYTVVVKIGNKTKEVVVNVYDKDDIKVTDLKRDFETTKSIIWTTDTNDNILPDLNNLYVSAYFSDGNIERVKITQDMIACSRDGNDVTVTVTYLGKTCTFTAVIGEKTSSYGLDVVFVDGEISQMTYSHEFIIASKVGTGILDENYSLLLSDETECFFCDLTVDMLKDGEGNSINLAGLPVNAYTVYIAYNGKSVGEVKLYIYDETEVEYYVKMSNNVEYLIEGTREDVLNQLNYFTFMYCEVADFRNGGDTYIYRRFLSFDELEFGDLSKIDFGKCGEISIPIKYRGRTIYLDVTLIPNLDLATRKSYLNKYTREYILYSNGYYETTDAQYRVVGQYEFVGGQQDIIKLNSNNSNDSLYELDNNNQKIIELRLSGRDDFTELGTYSDLENTKIVLYQKGELYYAEAYFIYDGGTNYIATILVDCDLENHFISFMGNDYTYGDYDETNECYVLSIYVTGKGIYAMFVSEGNSKVVFNDNFKAYSFSLQDTDWVVVMCFNWEYNEDRTAIDVYSGGRVIATLLLTELTPISAE